MTERVSITVTPPGVPDSKVFRRWAEVQATRQHYDELQWHWEKDADGKPMARLTGVMHEFTGTPMGAKAAWIEDPPSEEICHQLNAAGASLCMHNRNPCYLRCGVAWLCLRKPPRRPSSEAGDLFLRQQVSVSETRSSRPQAQNGAQTNRAHASCRSPEHGVVLSPSCRIRTTLRLTSWWRRSRLRPRSSRRKRRS